MRLAWLPLAAAAFVLGLAALVRMATPAAIGVHDIRGVIRLPERATMTIVTLFGLAALVALAHLVRRGLRRHRAQAEELAALPGGSHLPPWLVAIMRIFPLLYLLAAVYALWHGWIRVPDLMSLGGSGGGAIGSALPQSIPLSAPPLYLWVFGLLAFAVGLASLGLALWIALGDRWNGGRSAEPASEPPEGPLEQAVNESLDDLRTDPDPRRAIIGCYRRFEQAAAAVRVERRPWNTPLEFMGEALSRLPLPHRALGILTGLFERARFSHHPLGAMERDRALDALIEIKAAIDESEITEHEADADVTRPHVSAG